MNYTPMFEPYVRKHVHTWKITHVRRAISNEHFGFRNGKLVACMKSCECGRREVCISGGIEKLLEYPKPLRAIADVPWYEEREMREINRWMRDPDCWSRNWNDV